MNTFQPRLSPVALAVLLLSACGGGGGGGDSMVSTLPEPYVEIPGFVDKDSIRSNVVPASTKSIQTVFQGQVKFAQSHTIDPKGNAANNMPTLVPWRDTLLMFTPLEALNSGSVSVTAFDKEGRELGTLTMNSPDNLPANDQPLPDPRGVVNYSTKAWSVKLPGDWMQAGLSLKFVRTTDGAEAQLAANNIEFGASNSITLQTIRIGMLTEPLPVERNWWEMQPGISLLDYYQKIPVTQMTIGYYLPVYFEKVVLPSGKTYTTGTGSEDDGAGAHTGDMREYIGKVLISHGINFASFGLNSSQADELSPYTGKWELYKRYFNQITFHMSQGKYLNQIKGHGMSGGGGMATLFYTQGNEFSHELGHNYGLPHYIMWDPKKPGTERSAFHHYESGWGYDTIRNRMIGNISWVSDRNHDLEGKAPPVFNTKFFMNWDAMSGGEPVGVVSKFTHHTGWAASLIQKNLDEGCELDSSGTYLCWNPKTKTKEADTQSRPKAKRMGIPVMTLIGYYDPLGELPTTIYPSLWGSYGNTFEPSTMAPNDYSCRLRAYKNETEFDDYALDNQRFDEAKQNLSPGNSPVNKLTEKPQMNKFHVNFAMDALPVKVSVLCKDKDNANQLKTLDSKDIASPSSLPREAMTIGGQAGNAQVLKQVKNFDYQTISYGKPFATFAKLEEKIANIYGQVTTDVNQMAQGLILRQPKTDGTFDYLLQAEKSPTAEKVLLGNTGKYINFLPEPFASDKLKATGFEARLAEYYQTPGILPLEQTGLKLLTQGKVVSNIENGVKHYYLLLSDLVSLPTSYQNNTDKWIHLGTEASLAIAINPKVYSQKADLEAYLARWYDQSIRELSTEKSPACAQLPGTLYKVEHQYDWGNWLYMRQKIDCRAYYNLNYTSNEHWIVLGVLRKK